MRGSAGTGPLLSTIQLLDACFILFLHVHAADMIKQEKQLTGGK